MGIPDSQIILMLADDMPCNARNSFPGEVFNSQHHLLNIYGEDVEVDYRGTEVNVDSFLRLLTGRHHPSFPSSKTLRTNEYSNILIYMSGHGGDQFLKFHDFEEISSNDMSDAIKEMRAKKRYNEIFFMTDTCQAATLAKAIASPNVLTIGSSKLGENSYGGGSDYSVGTALTDRFTAATLDFFEKMASSGETFSMADLFRSYNPRSLMSHPEVRDDLFYRNLEKVPVTDFFGSVLRVVPYTRHYR
jgi:phosphatidylinositol glycan class K